MYIDELNEFCDATALDTGGAGTALIGDVIDLGAAVEDIAAGQPVYAVFTIDTDVDSAADGASVEFVIASDAAAAIAEDGTASEHGTTGVIAEADLASGREPIIVALNSGQSFERYLGILQKTTGEAITAGKVNAFLTTDPHKIHAHADAVS